MNNKNKILCLLDSMREVFNLCSLKVKKLKYDNELNDMLNKLIDGFVSISKNTPLQYYKVQQINEELADIFIKIVNIINENRCEELISLFDDKLINLFERWENILRDCFKYRIIVYGSNRYSSVLPDIIDYSKAEIVAYADNDANNIGGFINTKEIISLQEICKYEYDYLLIMGGDKELISESINDGKISSDKIFNFDRHYLIDIDYNFYKKYYGFIDSSKEFEGFITGLSYFEVGINTRFFKKNFFNFGVSSQDLFFDYHIMKYALEFENLKKHIKYTIIGLAYYEFHYDLSKSRNKNTIRTEIYYPILGTVHNYRNRENFIKEYKTYRTICNNILKSDYSRTIYNYTKTYYEKVLDGVFKREFDSKSLSEIKKEELIKDIKMDFNKKYPLTVEENKEILSSYLELLKLNNIKPIVLVCPATKLYRDNCSISIKNEFYDIINEMKSKYEFQFIDCFENEEFEDEYFYDTSHLNYKGAEKFTKLLNNIIEW